jgi:hypothetical protein
MSRLRAHIFAICALLVLSHQQSRAAELILGYTELVASVSEKHSAVPVLRAIERRLQVLGHDVILSKLPAKRLASELADGKVDLVLGILHDGTKDDATVDPLWCGTLEVLCRIDTAPSEPRMDRRIAMVRGLPIPGLDRTIFNPDIDVSEVNVFQQGVKMLLADRVDRMYGYGHEIDQLPLEMRQKLQRSVVANTDFHLVVRSDLKQKEALLASFDTLPVHQSPPVEAAAIALD